LKISCRKLPEIVDRKECSLYYDSRSNALDQAAVITAA